MSVKQYGFCCITAVAMVCCIGNYSIAQSMDVPVKNQLELFAKIFACDRNFSNRIGEKIVFGIIYQRTFRSSSAVKDDILSAWEISGEKVFGEIPSRYELIDVSSVSDLGKELERLHVNIIYVAPLRAYNIEKISLESYAKKIMTVTGVEEYADDGISVSLGIKNNRPQIIINLSSAKSEGADFASNFLKLVRVIR